MNENKTISSQISLSTLSSTEGEGGRFDTCQIPLESENESKKEESIDLAISAEKQNEMSAWGREKRK